jgi:hypothetical protein
MMEGSRMFMILAPLVVQQQGKSAAPHAAKSTPAEKVAASQAAKTKEDKVEKVKESANA